MRNILSFIIVTVLMALSGCSAARSGLAGYDGGMYAADGDTPDAGLPCPLACQSVLGNCISGCGEDAGQADIGMPDVDAGLPGEDGGSPPDVGSPDSGSPGMDAGDSDMGTPDVDAGADPITVTFPLAPPDTASPPFSGGYRYYNTTGDQVTGSRTTTLAHASGVSISIALSRNYLSGDTCDFRMLINGTEVGRFSVHAGTTNVSASFSFATISGPAYTLEYEVTRDVRVGSGSIAVDMDGASTVTLSP